MKFLNFFLFLWVVFALLDPDPMTWLNPNPNCPNTQRVLLSEFFQETSKSLLLWLHPKPTWLRIFPPCISWSASPDRWDICKARAGRLCWAQTSAGRAAAASRADRRGLKVEEGVRRGRRVGRRELPRYRTGPHVSLREDWCQSCLSYWTSENAHR